MQLHGVLSVRDLARPAPPTEGYCQTWAGIRIDEGHFGDIDLAGINVGLMIEIPGSSARGNWTAALFVDEKASIQAVKALTRIFTGRAGGSTGLAEDPGRAASSACAGADHLRDAGRDPHLPDREDHRRRDHADARQGQGRTSSSATANTGSRRDIIVARADKSRLRAFGRNWNFAGRSAEIVRLDWGNQKQR